MTYEENVRAILESNFAGFKDEIIETAIQRICEIRFQSIKWPNDLISRGALIHFIKEVRYSEKWAQHRIAYGMSGQLDKISAYICDAPSITPKYFQEKEKKNE